MSYKTLQSVIGRAAGSITHADRKRGCCDGQTGSAVSLCFGGNHHLQVKGLAHLKCRNKWVQGGHKGRKT